VGGAISTKHIGGNAMDAETNDIKDLAERLELASNRFDVVHTLAIDCAMDHNIRPDFSNKIFAIAYLVEQGKKWVDEVTQEILKKSENEAA
jgi:hypothetical protein